MRGWLLTFVLWTTVLWANARQFNTHWVAAPDTDSLAHVWFRTTLLSSARHREAHLTIATTGLVKVYVNEAKVGTALFYPSRPQGDTTAIALTLDVTPYLRPDSNVVAVLYSPGFPHATRRQVSAVFYGIDYKGQHFAYFSDKSWICRRAASGLTPDGHEWVDGRQADTPWTAGDFDVALWRHVVETQGPETTTAPLTQQQATACKSYAAYLPAEKIVRSRGYNYFDTNGNEVTYDYGRGFRGFVRLNLREVVSFSGIYGGLSPKNIPGPNTPGLYLLPDGCGQLGKVPYMEITAGIENIFEFLRIDYVRRISYAKNLKGWDKNGIRFTFRVSF